MPGVEIDLRSDKDIDIEIHPLVSGTDGEQWQMGDVVILVSDRISEEMAKELAFHWLSVENLREDIKSGEFWFWLGQAANEKVERDTAAFKKIPKGDNDD